MQRSTLLVAFGIVVLALLQSCADNTEQETDRVVSIDDWSLQASEIPLNLYEGKSAEDSTRNVQQYVEAWIRNILLYRHAEQEIGRGNLKIEKQVLDYRRALYTQSYESEYVREHLDTTISIAEQHQFYEENQELFLLKRTIVRVLLLTIPEQSQYMAQVRRHYTLQGGDASMQELSSLEMKAGVQLLLIPDTWYPLLSLGRYLPSYVDISFGNRRARHAEFVDDGKVYLLSFQEWKEAGTVAPFSYVQNEVKSIILNRREVALVRELEESIVSEGTSSGVVKFKK